MNDRIDIQKIRRDAEALYRNGGYFCSEAVVASIRDNLAPEMPAELIAAASGFPVGVGGSKCMCGAVSGAVICLGYLFGRTRPSSPQDAASQKCMALADELQKSFRSNHKGVLCCSANTKDVEWGSGEHIDQCVAFTGEMAEKTAEIAAREFGLAII